MSEGTIKEIIAAVVLLGSLALNLLISKKVDRNSKKVGEYHTAVNGKMEKLLKTTKELGKAEQAAEDKINGSIEEFKTEIHKNNTVKRKPATKKKK